MSLNMIDREPSDVKPVLQGLLSRLHTLVVGPGLGREKYMQTFATMAIGIAKEQVFPYFDTMPFRPVTYVCV